ncbi:membrane protein [Flexivirga endophytica]|uniref:Membrane protein n=1 Tax=Flexivirga endophytica TaxID=1849103 RepID=A0A916TAP9_9MICO|nr:DUF881 domain-containing protein [Flexivirga endophytica]GGB36697.1 membrane protein [Flexivirga endophytica]GHB44310.1 membrane protein [Flexivirga endophytica]
MSSDETPPVGPEPDPKADDEVDAKPDPTTGHEFDAEPTTPHAPEDDQVRTGWSRLWRAARPRLTRANGYITVLAALLGFAMVAQVQETRSSGLENLRQEDLVALLDGVNQQSLKLSKEADRLTRTKSQLETSGGDEAALKAATERLRTLGILAGTLPATGPGIRITIGDPKHVVKPSDVLNAVEELRDAGAEAIQLNSVRIVADSYFGTAGGDRLMADGTSVGAPYVITAIGDPHTMSTAMAIPGGVVESLKQMGAKPSVKSAARVDVTALRAASTPRYAQPSSS